MAGSQKEPSTVSLCSDPILAARLEAIKQLASGSSDRVAVLDRDFNVIYANESAWSEDPSRVLTIRPSAIRLLLTGTIPAAPVRRRRSYESPDVRSVACSSGGDGTACGMHQAFPLVLSSGEVESVLVLFKAPSKLRSRRAVSVWT